jgi:hypothetical protein
MRNGREWQAYAEEVPSAFLNGLRAEARKKIWNLPLPERLGGCSLCKTAWIGINPAFRPRFRFPTRQCPDAPRTETIYPAP